MLHGAHSAAKPAPRLLSTCPVPSFLCLVRSEAPGLGLLGPSSGPGPWTPDAGPSQGHGSPRGGQSLLWGRRCPNRKQSGEPPPGVTSVPSEVAAPTGLGCHQSRDQAYWRAGAIPGSAGPWDQSQLSGATAHMGTPVSSSSSRLVYQKSLDTGPKRKQHQEPVMKDRVLAPRPCPPQAAAPGSTAFP